MIRALPGYATLAIAILAEVLATSTLRASQGFTRLLPTVFLLGLYAVAFYCLSLTVRTVPVGVAYAIWSGVGTVLVSAIAWLVYRQSLDAAALAGIGLIIAGVLVIDLFSSTAGR